MSWAWYFMAGAGALWLLCAVFTVCAPSSLALVGLPAHWGHCVLGPLVPLLIWLVTMLSSTKLNLASDSADCN